MFFAATPYDHIAELIFVGDPMCSWCYGFTPQLSKLRSELSGVPFNMLMGGLRDGDVFDAQKLQNHLDYWEAVEKMTGLTFDARALSQEGFNYTTEPACRAVMSVKALDESQMYAMYAALQQAFYAEGKDVTQTEVLVEVAGSLGIDRTAFKDLFESEEMEKATAADKQKAGTYGVSSFPTLIIIDKQGHMSQIRGYKSYEALIPFFKKLS